MFIIYICTRSTSASSQLKPNLMGYQNMTILFALDKSFSVTLPIQALNVCGYKIEFVKYDGGFKIVSVNGRMISDLTNGEWSEVCNLISV